MPNYVLMHKQKLLETRYLIISTTILVNLPICRILCSLYLFNFQKQRAVVGDEAVAVNAAHKAVHQKKVTVKPKPEDIIVISPDTEEVDRVNKHLNKKKATEGSSKKRGQTFSSTLTARSKVHIT